MTDQQAEDTAPDEGRASGRDVSRRRLLGFAGAGAVAAGAAASGVLVGRASADENRTTDDPAGKDQYPFRGAHQAGIVTPAQDRLHFAAFDVTTTRRDELIGLLKAWTEAADRLTRGESAGPYGPVGGPYQAPPDDTGEAYGLPPSGLTITFGFGPTLFTTVDGVDRFKIAGARPKGLIDLPHFPADKLDPARSNGDLCVQACAHDPQVAVHAVRNLARIAFGTAGIRWSQLGFGRTSSTSTSQDTPRNLFGFKDGTANVKAEETAALDEHIWVQSGDDRAGDWMTDGSYLVARRISMHIETWDRTSLKEQEDIVGRDKGAGAPLSGGTEFTEPDFEARGRTADGKPGDPLIPADAHIKVAHPTVNDGTRILRRGYNFTDGSTGLGRLDAGLFFIAFVRDPVKQYVPMQTQLSSKDPMMEYLQHTGSGLFAVPPGVTGPSGFIGEPLFS